MSAVRYVVLAAVLALTACSGHGPQDTEDAAITLAAYGQAVKFYQFTANDGTTQCMGAIGSGGSVAITCDWEKAK